MKNKKSQITVFIILGLLIVTAGFVIFSVQRSTQKEIPLDVIIEDVEPEILPVKTFVESCLNKLSKEAILKLGSHGGYIDPLLTTYVDMGFNFDIVNPAEADGVTLSYNQFSFVPYWFYLKSPSECLDCQWSINNIPPNELIEYEIAAYVETNLPVCLDDFKGFEYQNFVVEEQSPPRARAMLAETDVVVGLEYPLEVRRGERKSEFKNYVVKHQVNLRRILQLSKAIAVTEANYNYLEYVLSHIITINSGIDANLLPPIGDADSSFSTTTWILPMVEMKLKDLIRDNIPLLQLNGTKGVEKPEFNDDYLQGIYDVFWLDLFETSFEELGVSFIYDPSWNIYIDIKPRDGNRLTPESVRSSFGVPFVPSYQSNTYTFYYTVGLPLVIEVKDDEAFDKEGYSFLFAIEANLKNNRPPVALMVGKGVLNSGSFPDLTSQEVSPTQVNIGDDEMNLMFPDEVMSQVDTENLGASRDNAFEDTPTSIEADQGLEEGAIKKKIICEYGQRLSGNITIYVYNAQDSSPLDESSVSYMCGEYATCPVGGTKLEGDIAVMREKFPLCLGGNIIVEQEGFLKQIIPFNSTLDKEASMNVFLQPFRTINTKALKFSFERNNIPTMLLESEPLVKYPADCWYPYNDPLYAVCPFPLPVWYLYDNVTEVLTLRDESAELTSTDELIVILKRIKSKPFDDDFAGFTLFKGSSVGNEMILVPGNYTLKTMLIDKSETIIPRQERRYKGINEPVFVPESDQILSSRLSGGSAISESAEMLVEIRPNSLYSDATTLVFPVLEFPKPIVVEHLEEMGMVENKSTTYREYVQPYFLIE
ncbi:hypothetical protein ACFL0W_04810 [Nanoarchaeota archaeon]